MTTNIPFVFFGAIIDKDRLEHSLSNYDYETDNVLLKLEHYLKWLKSDLFTIDCSKLVMNNEDNCVFIGRGIKEMPDHVSKKRFCLDIHNELISCNLLYDKDIPDAVNLLVDLYQVVV